MTPESVFVGLDIGGTTTRVGVFDVEGHVLSANRMPTPAKGSPETAVSQMIALIESVIDEPAFQRGRFGLAGIGIGCTGPVHPAQGIINNPHTLPGWGSLAVTSNLAARFGVPITLENDADAAGLGEYWRGAGREVDRLFAVTVGTGIGTGFILDGRIYRGQGGQHPESGHIAVDPTGPQCYCGQHGCWESLASGTAIASRARMGLLHTPTSRLASVAHSGGESIDSASVFDAAGKGDPLARDVVEKAAEAFSLGIANIILSFLPEMIVLGGGVMERLEFFQPALERMTSEINVMVPATQVKIVPALLGAEAGLYGAAYAVISRTTEGGC